MEAETRRHTLQELNTSHREIVRLKLLGKPTAEIAHAVGRHPQYITKVLGDPLCKAHMESLQAKADEEIIGIRKRIQRLAPKAVETMEHLMEFGPENVRLNAAKDMLDRAGYSPIQKSLNVNVDAIYNEESKSRIKERMRQAEESGLVVDVEPLEDPPELPEGL